MSHYSYEKLVTAITPPRLKRYTLNVPQKTLTQ